MSGVLIVLVIVFIIFGLDRRKPGEQSIEVDNQNSEIEKIEGQIDIAQEKLEGDYRVYEEIEIDNLIISQVLFDKYDLDSVFVPQEEYLKVTNSRDFESFVLDEYTPQEVTDILEEIYNSFEPNVGIQVEQITSDTQGHRAKFHLTLNGLKLNHLQPDAQVFFTDKGIIESLILPVVNYEETSEIVDLIDQNVLNTIINNDNYPVNFSQKLLTAIDVESVGLEDEVYLGNVVNYDLPESCLISESELIYSLNKSSSQYLPFYKTKCIGITEYLDQELEIELELIVNAIDTKYIK